MSAHSERESDRPAESSVDWGPRIGGRRNRLLIWLEGITLRVERGIAWLVRRPDLNPVYHSGTITIFLLALVYATGIYLTMFFQFGFEASYDAVTALEGNLVGRFMRAVHRYASIGAIVMAAIHGWRTFVMRRFDGARRWPWATGIAMVAVLWVIGVTGYWLIWDERAQVLNDALTRAIAGTRLGLDFLIDTVLTDAAGSGWPFMLMLITVHVGLSVGVGALLWYHLRRLSRRHWMPPPVWLWIIGATVVVVSVAIPVGMLPALDRHLIPGDIPIDPFFLFLLPGTLTWPPGLLWPAATVVLALVAFLPWVLRTAALEPVVVSAERCIGCTYCVADCPYTALEMVPRDDGPHQLLAVVTPERCVSCGICIGSCPTKALTLGAAPAEPLWDHTTAAAAGRRVVFVCERHAVHGARPVAWVDSGDDPLVVPLPCIGMAHPQLAVDAVAAGATAVRFLGCPADDCANLEGNVWLQQRLDRKRRPRLRSTHVADPITTAWIPPDQAASRWADGADAPATIRDVQPFDAWGIALPALVLTFVVGLGTVAVTTLPFDPGGNDDARIEIALDHRDGAPLAVTPDVASPADGLPARLVLDVDGERLLERTYPLVTADGGPTSLALERITVAPGTHEVTLRLVDGDVETTVFADTVALDAGQALTIDVGDGQLLAQADAGRSLYFETTLGTNAGCRICHSLDPGVTLVGPSFAGVATRAETRVPGLSATDYLKQSIVDPDAYVVEGFPAGQMVPNYLDLLSEEDIDNLVAFLLTLK